MNASKPGKGWAVVTGASSGLGLLFARSLAQRGHPVLAVARRLERLEELTRQVAVQGGRVVPLAADLQTSEAVQAVARRATELGDVEVLVNSAGFGTWGAFADLSLDRELGLIRLNVAALVELTHRLLPPMIERGRGGVINMASLQAFFPMPYLADYAASKAFVLSFSESLAHELKNSGVRICVICPGPAKTEFADVTTAYDFQNALPNLTADQVVAAALKAYDRGRVVTVVGPVNNVLAFMPRLLPRAAMRALMASFTKPKAPKGAAKAA
jgi:short-subunit dehydrogenase